MRAACDIRALKKIDVFDGKRNGRLTLWQVNCEMYDLYITKVISGNVWVDASLRCDDHELLERNLRVLREEARSVRIIRPFKP
jgi:hypothetical protein